jgi:hypothetical protein
LQITPTTNHIFLSQYFFTHIAFPLSGLFFFVFILFNPSMVSWPAGSETMEATFFSSKKILLIATSLCIPGIASLVSRMPATTKNLSFSNDAITCWRPLILLPVAITPLWLKPFLPEPFAANIVFFLPIFLLALCLARLSAAIKKNPTTNSLSLPFILVSGLAFFIFFWIGGWYFSTTAGEHAGDEGHYIIQAKSLYQDHDLDILNNLDEKEQHLLQRWGKEYFHISPASKNNHFYSWHSFGLPLLMSPFVSAGLGGRHFLLGFLSALGSVGILMLCRFFQATPKSTLILVVLFCFSSYWGVYSCRALPEICGATLTLWMVFAIFQQDQHPQLSLFLAVSTCILLPWIQTRFIPVSITGACLYGVYCLTLSVPFKQKIKRLLLLSTGIFIGYFAYMYVHYQMFENGSAYPVGNLLFSYPPGMLKILTSSRSVTYVFPLFSLLLASTLHTIIFNHRYRLHALCVFFIFLSVLTTSCATAWWCGGASMNGRFLLAVAPTMIPFGVLVYGRSTPAIQWFFLFTGLISCVLFGLTLANLSLFGKYFTDPMFSLAAFQPLYCKGLYNFFLTPYNWYGITFYLIIFLLIFTSHLQYNRTHVVFIILLVAVSGYNHKMSQFPPPRKLNLCIMSPYNLATLKNMI